MQIKEILSTLNYEKQMFLRLLLLVTIPILVMGVVSYNIYISSENANSQLALEFYSTEISREYDTILTSIKEYYIETVNNDTFRWLLHQDKVPYSRYSSLKDAQKALEGNYFIHNYIEEYNFINMDHGWIFNDYGLFPYEDLENLKETEAFLEGQKMVNSELYWVNRSEVSPPMVGNGLRLTNSVDTSGLQLVIKNQRDGGGLSWLLSIKIDTRNLQSLSENYKKTGYDISVLGGVNRSVLMETNPDMTETYDEHEEEGSGVYKGTKAGKYRIQVKEDVSNGMTYVVGYDTGKVKADAAVFMFAALAVILGFGILLAAVRIAAVAFSKPLYLMQKHMDDQKTQIKELLISNLIKGELNQNRIEEALKNSEIIPFPCYRMVVMKYKDESEEAAREKYIRVLSEFPENLKQMIFITPIYYREKLVVLIGAENEQVIDTKTAVLYKEIKDHMELSGKCATASGISRVFHSLDQVRQAYSECTEALYNKTNQEDMNVGSLVLFDDYASLNQSTNVYDRIMETEMIQMIESCKSEDAIHLLELILDRMETKGVVGIERNFYLTRLLTAVMNIPATAGIPLSDIFGSDQYNVLNQLTQIYDKKKLLKAVKNQMILPIISRLEEKEQQGNESEIVRQVLELIRSSKGNISLNECADQLSYHPNYLSKVLKREKGVTFTDIVNEEKMTQAKYMLLTTEYSVAEISEKLQYTNVQNFIRFFKNHEGVTPAAFRKERRN